MPEIVGNGNADGKGKTVMVTGWPGMVGEAIRWAVTEGNLRNPDETWVFITIDDADLTKENDVKRVFETYRPTHVIHLAAMVGGLFHNMRYPAQFYDTNILMNTYIIRFSHIYGVKKCISMLSTCIFPDGIRLPMTEKDVHLGPPHSSNFAYAYAKRMIDIQNEAYHRQYGSMFTSLVSVNIYGPYDNFSIEEGHVMPGLMHKMYLADKKKESAVVWGSGKPRRQFIYSRDIARCIIWMLHNYSDHETLICVSDDCEISIKDAAEKIAKAMDFKNSIKFDASFADGQFIKTASNAKFKALAPDFKFTPIDVAIKETCDWFKANYETCRK